MWLCGCGRGKLISRFSYLETHHLFYSRRILFSSQSIPNVNRGILETEVFPPNEPRKFSASKTVLSARLLQSVTRTYSSFEKSCCYLRKHADGHHNHLGKEQWTGRGLELEALGWTSGGYHECTGQMQKQRLLCVRSQVLQDAQPCLLNRARAMSASATASTSPPRSSFPNVILH